MAKKVYVLTVSSYEDDVCYEVYDSLEKTELARSIYYYGLDDLEEEDFEKLRTYANVGTDSFDTYVENGEIDDLGQLNKDGLRSIKELITFLKKNDYEIEDELKCEIDW